MRLICPRDTFMASHDWSNLIEVSGSCGGQRSLEEGWLSVNTGINRQDMSGFVPGSSAVSRFLIKELVGKLWMRVLHVNNGITVKLHSHLKLWLHFGDWHWYLWFADKMALSLPSCSLLSLVFLSAAVTQCAGEEPHTSGTGSTSFNLV